MVAYSVWMVLLPLVVLLGTIHVLPLQLALKHVQRARAAGAASVAAGIILTNLLPQAEYQRVLAGGTLDTLIAELEAQTERLRQR